MSLFSTPQSLAGAVAAAAAAAALCGIMVARALASKLGKEVERLDAKVEGMEVELKRAVSQLDKLSSRLEHLDSLEASSKGGRRVTDGGDAKASRAKAREDDDDDDDDDEYGELRSWDVGRVQNWVQASLVARAGFTQADAQETSRTCFAEVSGQDLRSMALDAQHGFSFADKLFFLGLDKKSIAASEDSLAELR